MKNLEHKLSELQTIFDEIAISDWLLSGLLAKEQSAKEVHSAVTKGIVILSGIGTVTIATNLSEAGDIREKIMKESKKVERRLKLWAKPERQGQINAKILNAFLELKRSGNKNITEKAMRTLFETGVAGNSPFQTNFNQMKSIAKNNHGKVFELNRNYVEIWEPVQVFVDEYERTVFNNN